MIRHALIGLYDKVDSKTCYQTYNQSAEALMRTVFVGIFVLLIVGICLAQTSTEVRTQPDPTSETSLRVIPPAPPRVFAIDQLPPIITFQFRKDPSYSANPQDQLHVQRDVAMQTCYAIGAYLFSQDVVDSAPRQTGYTTCVPSEKVQVREVRPILEFPPQ